MDPATRLVRRLAVLPEVAMREAVLVETLGALAPAEAVGVLQRVTDAAARDRDLGHRVAIAALAGALERLPYVVRRDLYEAAKTAGADGIARLFLDAAPVAELPPAPEQLVPGTGRSVTLGERKTLARGGRRELVVALLGDPDASVIKSLLENPRLTERDVLAVAARRPGRGEVLRQISASRWCARYHVQRALVLNPATPVDVAVRLVWTLSPADLRFVGDDAQLAEPVRAQARLALSSSCRPP
jgi:hypothetical protein